MGKSVKDPENLVLIPDQEQRQRCLASRRVTFAVLEMFSAVWTFTQRVQQFAAWDSDAKTNLDLLETSVGSILLGKCTSLICIRFAILSHISSAKVLAHST
jgi:hypothetical protein